MISMKLIEVKDLKKIYKPKGKEAYEIAALDGVNLTISQGEFVAIVGPSGSGKSTLLQVFGLLDRPSSGQYFFFDQDVSKFTDAELAYIRCQYIGFVFQFYNLLPRATALANVELPLIYSQTLQRREKAKELLSKVGLKDRLHQAPHQLSGGEQQRVAIARALANNPQVILADEPTGNINQKQAKEFMAHLSHLHKKGVTIVLVTHDPNVASYAERIIKLEVVLSVKANAIGKEDLTAAETKQLFQDIAQNIFQKDINFNVLVSSEKAEILHPEEQLKKDALQNEIIQKAQDIFDGTIQKVRTHDR